MYYHGPMRRISARAIVLMNDKKVILIHRVKEGYEYWVTPGGGVEEGESFEEAVVRELKEEVGIDVHVDKLMLDIRKNVDGIDSEQKFFLCTYAGGEIGSGTGNEVKRSHDTNLHEVVLVDLVEAKTINIVPEEVKQLIVSKLKA